MCTDAQPQSRGGDLAVQSPDLVTVPRQCSHVLRDSCWRHSVLHSVARSESMVKLCSRKLSAGERGKEMKVRGSTVADGNVCGVRQDWRKSLRVILSYEEEIDFGKNMTSLGGKNPIIVVVFGVGHSSGPRRWKGC